MRPQKNKRVKIYKNAINSPLCVPLNVVEFSEEQLRLISECTQSSDANAVLQAGEQFWVIISTKD